MRRIAITPGEPAGIGPDLLIALAQDAQRDALIAICDPDLLRARAALIGLPLEIRELKPDDAATATDAGVLQVLPIELRRADLAEPGRLAPENAAYVLDTLAEACDGCMDGRFEALVTGPVHKGVINDAGLPFTGHTEYLAERSGAYPVMMLTAPGLRVALATTHLPLSDVPAAITRPLLERVLRILRRDLRQRYRIAEPRVLVCGLNPHAGEGGHLGREEIEIIEPVMDQLRGEGFAGLEGPLPADTLFVPRKLEHCDAVLAMYHDQGLPVLKHLGFGRAVNVTLGLPFVRTSVDHGTALDLAGRGVANRGSLDAALDAARELMPQPREG